jgi:hypothetical protein
LSLTIPWLELEMAPCHGEALPKRNGGRKQLSQLITSIPQLFSREVFLSQGGERGEHWARPIGQAVMV